MDDGPARKSEMRRFKVGERVLARGSRERLHRKTIAPDTSRRADLQLIFVGDVMLGRLVNEVLKDAPPEYPWGNTLPIFAASDFRVCNLECAISDRGSPWSATPKLFHFRTDAGNVAVLRAAGINAVSLANNHALDYEEDALLDTVSILDGNGILHAGAGANISEAERPATAKVRGIRLGFIAFTDNEPDWEAAESKPGIFYVPIDPLDERARHLFGLISEAKRDADILIVSTHWGPNWGYEPLNEHIGFGHVMVEAGADIVFGHSPHIFRGIEIYRGRPILYSAGNFIDDYAVDEIERNDETCIFMLEMTDNMVSRVTMYPALIENFQVNVVSGSEADTILGKMQSLCAGLGTQSFREDDRLVIRAG